MPYTLEHSTRVGRQLLWAAVNDLTGEPVFTDADRKAVQNMVDALNEQERAWALSNGMEPPPPARPNRSALAIIYDVLFALMDEDKLKNLVGTDATYVEVDNVLTAIDNHENLEDPVSHRRLRPGRPDRPGRPLPPPPQGPPRRNEEG